MRANRKALALGIAALVLLGGCSSGAKRSSAPTTTRQAVGVGTGPTTTSPARPVNLGPCPRVDPDESGVPFNEGVRGLAKEMVPLTATTVRVCSYQDLGTGGAAITSGIPALPAAQLEAETNSLERYPVGSEVGGGCVLSPRGLFVTFANEIRRASVAYTDGCAAPASNRVLLAHPTQRWIRDIENFTDNSLTADDIMGTWRPISIAGYRGPLRSPPLAVAPEVSFDGTSKWAGSDGCNYTSGSYRFGPRNTAHFTVVSTKRLCSQPAPPDPLQHSTRIELHDDRLTFFGSGGSVLAQYELVSRLGPPIPKS